MSSSDRKTFIEHMTDWFTLPRLISAIVLTFFLVSILFPFYWMVSSSFKSRAEIGGREAVYFPSEFRLEAYKSYLIPATKAIRNLAPIYSTLSKFQFPPPSLL